MYYRMSNSPPARSDVAQLTSSRLTCIAAGLRRTEACPRRYHLEPSGMYACCTVGRREARSAAPSLSHRAVLSAFPCKEVALRFPMYPYHQATPGQRKDLHVWPHVQSRAETRLVDEVVQDRRPLLCICA